MADLSHLSWSCGIYGDLKPSQSADCGLLRRHARIMNVRDVRVLLFSPHAMRVARSVSHSSLAQLAYVLGGTGGLGARPTSRWGPTWYGAGPARSLAWSDQRADSGNFMLPWQTAMWRRSPCGQPRDLQPGACGARDAEALAALHGLHQCALAPVGGEMCIDAGQVPYDLPRLASALGVPPAEQAAALAAVIRAELEGDRGTTKQRALLVAHHYRLLGVPLEDVGSDCSPTLAPCQKHSCQRLCRNLFQLLPDDGAAAATIVDQTCSEAVDVVRQRLDGQGAKRAKQVLESALKSHGVCVCFVCAAPALTDAYVARRARQRAGGASSSDGGDATTDEHLGRGARVHRQTVSQETVDRARMADQRAAVTAEARAIGVQPDAGRTLLRRVPARASLQLCSGIRGDTSIVGKLFYDGDQQWIVADVAPSGVATDGHTVAYVFDASARISVAGRLRDSCKEMEVALVRRMLAAEAATAPVSPPDPISESRDDFGQWDLDDEPPASAAGDVCESCDEEPPEQQRSNVAAAARFVAHALGVPPAQPSPASAADTVAPADAAHGAPQLPSSISDDDGAGALDLQRSRGVAHAMLSEQSSLPPPPVHSPSDLLDDLLDMGDAADWLPPPERPRVSWRPSNVVEEQRPIPARRTRHEQPPTDDIPWPRVVDASGRVVPREGGGAVASSSTSDTARDVTRGDAGGASGDDCVAAGGEGGVTAPNGDSVAAASGGDSVAAGGEDSAAATSSGAAASDAANGGQASNRKGKNKGKRKGAHQSEAAKKHATGAAE